VALPAGVGLAAEAWVLAGVLLAACGARAVRVAAALVAMPLIELLGAPVSEQASAPTANNTSGIIVRRIDSFLLPPTAGAPLCSIRHAGAGL
jgi:hypothetical protein